MVCRFQIFYIQRSFDSSLISVFLEMYLEAANQTFKYGTTILTAILKKRKAQYIWGMLSLDKCFLKWIKGRSIVTTYKVMNDDSGLFEPPKIFSHVRKMPYESMGNQTVVQT